MTLRNSGCLIVGVLCLYMTQSLTTGLQCYECTDLLLESSDEEVNRQFKPFGKKCNLTEENLKRCGEHFDGVEAKCFTRTTHIAGSYDGKQVKVAIADRMCQRFGDEKQNGCTDKTLEGEGVTLPPYVSALGGKLDQFVSRECYCSSDKCNNEEVSLPSGYSPLQPALTLTLACLVFTFTFGKLGTFFS